MDLKTILSNYAFKNTNRPTNHFAEDIIVLRYGGLTALVVMLALTISAFLNYLDPGILVSTILVLFCVGVFFALKRYGGSYKPNTIDYFDGFRIGLATGIIASVLMTIFVGIFLEAQPAILERVNGEFFQGYGLDSFGIAILSFVVGIPASFIVSLVCMQYFKKEA
jgi:hypothetical protein